MIIYRRETKLIKLDQKHLHKITELAQFSHKLE